MVKYGQRVLRGYIGRHRTFRGAKTVKKRADAEGIGGSLKRKSWTNLHFSTPFSRITLGFFNFCPRILAIFSKNQD